MLSSKGSSLQDSSVPLIYKRALGISKNLGIEHVVLSKLI